MLIEKYYDLKYFVRDVEKNTDDYAKQETSHNICTVFHVKTGTELLLIQLITINKEGYFCLENLKKLKSYVASKLNHKSNQHYTDNYKKYFNSIVCDERTLNIKQNISNLDCAISCLEKLALESGSSSTAHNINKMLNQLSILKEREIKLL